MNDQRLYIESITELNRYKSREVKVGNVGIGGGNPIRIQSMTTTDTMDTEATVQECIELIEAGCELVRITAPGKREAENLLNIKKELKKRGYNTPLVADIHFTPVAAEVAAKIIEKVRVNPGNYIDKKKFKIIEYDDTTYQKEIDKIKKRFSPLVEICKTHGTAMRIGTNHGSLSDRILSKYGDTPEGMVESAMEFLRICKDLDYHNVILSMKASNTIIMVQAYRLLIIAMKKEGMNYPLHLGVTEAGDGDDGRVKSAVGMGTLLLDGIGDTIRVSLTEAPVEEIPVAKSMLENLANKKAYPQIETYKQELPYSPFRYVRRKSLQRDKIGDGLVPVVVSDLSSMSEITRDILRNLDLKYDANLDKWKIGDLAPDYLFTTKSIDFELTGMTKVIQPHALLEDGLKLYSIEEYKSTSKKSKIINFISVDSTNYDACSEFQDDPTVAWVLSSNNENKLLDLRRWILELEAKNKLKHSVLVSFNSSSSHKLDLQMQAASYLGALFLDGLIDGIWMKPKNITEIKIYNELAFGILQSSRVRSSKTEYISCPSCGRTLFDLQETTNKVRQATEHLKGLKIGVMGCIVNGPGEMADAHYGYVGTGVGKISLYKGQEVVKRNLESSVAVEELVNLIKENGDWKEKS
ncbi:MAG: (E)-4-hydroxy-3-methylbut-2-enyl-diphosphate synthase [Flavobacteriales bacterium]